MKRSSHTWLLITSSLIDPPTGSFLKNDPIIPGILDFIRLPTRRSAPVSEAYFSETLCAQQPHTTRKIDGLILFALLINCLTFRSAVEVTVHVLRTAASASSILSVISAPIDISSQARASAS